MAVKDLVPSNPLENPMVEARTLTEVVRALASDLQIRAKTETGLLRPDAWKKTHLQDVAHYIASFESSLHRLVLLRATHLIDVWHTHNQDSVDAYSHSFHFDHPYGHHVLYAYGVIFRFDLRFSYVDSRGYLTDTPSKESVAKVKLLTIQAVTPMNAEITFGDQRGYAYWVNPNPTASIPENPLPPEKIVTGRGSVFMGSGTGRPCATSHEWYEKPSQRDHYTPCLGEPWFDHPVIFPPGVKGTVHNVWSYHHHPGYMGPLTERPLGYPHDPEQWGYDVLPGPWWAPIKVLTEALENLAAEAPDFRDPLRNAKSLEVMAGVEKEEQNFMDSFLAVALGPGPTRSTPRIGSPGPSKSLPSKTR